MDRHFYRTICREPYESEYYCQPSDKKNTLQILQVGGDESHQSTTTTSK